MSESLTVITHPLARHKLTMLRKKECFVAHFRQMMQELGALLCMEASRSLTVRDDPIDTPLAKHSGVFLDQSEIMILPILRAGLNMAAGFEYMMPMARIGHLGLLRQGSDIAHYFTSIPPVDAQAYFVIDPIVATGDTMTKALSVILESGVAAEKIKVMTLIMSEHGARRLTQTPEFNHIQFWTVEIDPQISSNGYVLPGMGDAGDRLFGSSKSIERGS